MKIKTKILTSGDQPEATSESVDAPLSSPLLTGVPSTAEASGAPVNLLLEETFEEMKARLFKRNFERLERVRRKYPKEMLNVLIKQHEGRFVSLWKGGDKIISLMNNEILYHSLGDTELFLKRFLGELPNDQVEEV
jgi:hypothetical protein